MKWYLISLGIPYCAIYEEDKALDTFENVKFSLDLLKRLGITSFQITVATQWQHAIRFFVAFLFGNHISVKLKFIRYKIPFAWWCREWLFILYHLYDWKGTKRLARVNRDNRRRT
jgi:hypothetical protein